MKLLKQTVTLSLLSSVALLGATPNINSGNIEKQIQAPKDIPTHQKPSVAIEGLESSEAIKDFDNNKKAFIKDFSFSGNIKISSEELNAIVKDYVNKELTFKQIKEVLSLINNYYRDKGYFVARAYLPQQELSKNNNILKISILEGNYGEFKLENSSLVSDKVIQDILDSVKDKDIISFNTIERVTNLINDRAGSVVTKASISPGQKVGTSDFDIGVESTKRVDGYIVADNYGSRYTGYNRVQG
ncbi:POTRA domain-containing protein, partial [Aliarcobacter cryaerophilus]